MTGLSASFYGEFDRDNVWVRICDQYKPIDGLKLTGSLCDTCDPKTKELCSGSKPVQKKTKGKISQKKPHS